MLTTPGSLPNWLAPDQLKAGSDSLLRGLRQILQGVESFWRSRFTRPEVRPFAEGGFLHDCLFPPRNAALLQHVDDRRHKVGKHDRGREIRRDGKFLDLKVGEPSSQAVFCRVIKVSGFFVYCLEKSSVDCNRTTRF